MIGRMYRSLSHLSPGIGCYGSECFGRDGEFGELILEFAHVCRLVDSTSVHSQVDSTSVHIQGQRMK